VTKGQLLFKEVQRLKALLRERDSDYLRALLTKSDGSTTSEEAAAARALLRERVSRTPDSTEASNSLS
jgi:hypothetical protein